MPRYMKNSFIFVVGFVLFSLFCETYIRGVDRWNKVNLTGWTSWGGNTILFEKNEKQTGHETHKTPPRKQFSNVSNVSTYVHVQWLGRQLGRFLFWPSFSSTSVPRCYLHIFVWFSFMWTSRFKRVLWNYPNNYPTNHVNAIYPSASFDLLMCIRQTNSYQAR